jgi:hypothetical protein
MSNRLLILLTAAVLAGILILFGINMQAILKDRPLPEPYLQYNNVKGMAIIHHQQPYTLNFEQQTQVINTLNRALPTMELPRGKQEAADFEALVIYQFKEPTELRITPIAYINNDLVFTQPDWHQNGYLMEVSDGQLRSLLSETYDH